MPEHPKPRRQVRERVQMKRRRMRAPKLTAKREERRERRAEWAVAVKARDRMCQARWPVLFYTPAPRCAVVTTDAHHVLPKSAGGTDEMWNGLGLCNPCHMWVHDHREAAQALGLLAHVGDCSDIEPVGASDREAR